jgi:hypothetical protein
VTVRLVLGSIIVVLQHISMYCQNIFRVKNCDAMQENVCTIPKSILCFTNVELLLGMSNAELKHAMDKYYVHIRSHLRSDWQ